MSYFFTADGTEVPRCDVHDAVGEPEAADDLLLDGEDRLVLRGRRSGRREDEHLHLVELVDAEDAPGVLAGGTGLAAEARRVAGVPPRQGFGLEDLAGVQAGEGHLRGAR